MRDDTQSGTFSAPWTVANFDLPLFVPSSGPYELCLIAILAFLVLQLY